MAKGPEPRVICANEPNLKRIFEAMARIRGEQCGCEFTVKLLDAKTGEEIK